MQPRVGRHLEDLQARIETDRWTLEGVFPLTGFLTSSLFGDSGPTAIYRLLDDPAIEATRNAAADLVARAAELEKRETRLPVVFTCVAAAGDPDRRAARALERAARDVFSNSPRFQVQAHAEVENALAPSEKGPDTAVRDAFRAGNINAQVEERLHEAFGPRLLVVVIRQADAVADVDYYQTKGQVLDAEKPRQETISISTSGFGRDRRDRWARS